MGHFRFIQVKGWHVDGDGFMPSNNLIAWLNRCEAVIRADDALKHVMVRRVVARELGFAETAVAISVTELLSPGAAPL